MGDINVLVIMPINQFDMECWKMGIYGPLLIFSLQDIISYDDQLSDWPNGNKITDRVHMELQFGYMKIS